MTTREREMSFEQNTKKVWCGEDRIRSNKLQTGFARRAELSQHLKSRDGESLMAVS